MMLPAERFLTKMAAGRPTDYSLELADEIFAQIALGYSLRTICKDESMPCVATVFSWLRTKPEFLDRYEKAKEEQADALAEEMLDIADDGTNDWMEKHNKDGSTFITLNAEHVQRSRLRVDTRKWIASKLKPKKYGDKQSVEVAGKDGGDIGVSVSAGASGAVRQVISSLTSGRADSHSGKTEVDQSSTTGSDTTAKK